LWVGLWVGKSPLRCLKRVASPWRIHANDAESRSSFTWPLLAWVLVGSGELRGGFLGAHD
jgi:hypothetical protein